MKLRHLTIAEQVAASFYHGLGIDAKTVLGERKAKG